MREFFEKYGSSSQDPYAAIELLCEELYAIKEKVRMGDMSHVQELVQLKTMIDDYLRNIQNYNLQPRQKQPKQKGFKGQSYKHYRPEWQDQYQQPMGFHPFPPIIYPPFPMFAQPGQGGQQQQGGDQGGGQPRPGQGGQGGQGGYRF